MQHYLHLKHFFQNVNELCKSKELYNNFNILDLFQLEFHRDSLIYLGLLFYLATTGGSTKPSNDVPVNITDTVNLTCMCTLNW